MKQDYFTRLTLAARWRMPPGEAKELLADYREILEENPRTEEELLRELGRPWTAVRLAADSGAYRRWLAAFAALSLCLLLPALCTLLPGVWWLFSGAFPHVSLEIVLLAAGLALSLAYFQRQDRDPLPVLLPILLLLLLALSAGINWWVWRILPGLRPAAGLGPVARLAYELLLLAAALLGLFGLTAARVYNRRWRALYVLALTVAVLTCAVLLMLGRMDMDAGIIHWDAHIDRFLWIAAIGLTGTGVALC